MKKISVALILLAMPLVSIIAQNNHRCGVGLDDGALIKQRMMENRIRMPHELVEQLRTPNTITYIPLGINNVGDANGNGYTPVSQILAMVCDLNADYADQDIQFYIKDSIRYLKNAYIYNDAMSFQATLAMSTNKKPNALNIYMSPTVNNSVASFYNPGGDFVFVITSELNGTSNTATHECGHFFSLNHTFFGWEGTNYHPAYNTATTPSTMGGEQVEKFARTGSGANCQTAADGFCDTEADYFSDREPCPYVGAGGFVAKDPTGATINPDESLYMSYFYDNCVTRFSAEQKAAIASDVASRGWSNLPAPNPSSQLSGSNVTAVSPISSQLVHVDGTNNITLQWNALAGATAYLVTLDRTLFGTFISNVFTGIVYNATTYTFSTSALTLPTGSQQFEYTWKIMPINSYYTCASNSSGFVFKTTSQPVVGVEQLESLQVDMQVMPNPVQGSEIALAVNTEDGLDATIRLYSLDGKMVSNFQNQQFAKGKNSLLLDVANLSNGVYLATLITERGTIARKFVIAR